MISELSWTDTKKTSLLFSNYRCCISEWSHLQIIQSSKQLSLCHLTTVIRLSVYRYRSRFMTNPTKWLAPREDSDQPGHPPSLIRVFAIRMKKAWTLSHPLCAERRLIRLSGCPGWSESSLDAQPHCWFCHEAAHSVCVFVFNMFWSFGSIGLNTGLETMYRSTWD